jgi:hypothetical protein
MRMRTQKLYAIRNTGTGHLKIGLAINPQARCKSLQTGASHKLELVLEGEPLNPRAAEAYVHSELAAYRLNGEWFELDGACMNNLPNLFAHAASQSTLSNLTLCILSPMVEVRLKKVLDQHKISAYRLGQEVEGLNPKTVEMYASGLRQPSLDGLGKIIAALRRLTKTKVEVGDLLEYVPEPDPFDQETKAWLESDLSRLGEYEPYDWGDEDPKTLGSPVEYVPGKGLLVLEKGS